MKGLLWGLLPDELLPLLVLGIAFAVIFGFLKKQIWLTLLGLVIVPLLIAPFIESAFGGLPLWILISVLLLFGLFILSALLEMTLGKHAAGHVVGELAAKFITGFFSLLLLPARLLFRAIFPDRRRREEP